MNGDEKKLDQGIELTNLQCADMIDWNVNCFPIGAKVEGKENEMPWLELDRDDLRTLELLLTKKMQLSGFGPGGPSQTITQLTVLSPIDESESLAKLAGWCKAVIAWMDSRRPRG
jgi:hypothetical protein